MAFLDAPSRWQVGEVNQLAGELKTRRRQHVFDAPLLRDRFGTEVVGACGPVALEVAPKQPRAGGLLIVGVDEHTHHLVALPTDAPSSRAARAPLTRVAPDLLDVDEAANAAATR